MEKVVAAFGANPCLQTALKVHAHLARHPMAECMASEAQRALIFKARLIAAGRDPKEVI
jgi:hypothetical protein